MVLDYLMGRLRKWHRRRENNEYLRRHATEEAVKLIKKYGNPLAKLRREIVLGNMMAIYGIPPMYGNSFAGLEDKLEGDDYKKVRRFLKKYPWYDTKEAREIKFNYDFRL